MKRKIIIIFTLLMIVIVNSIVNVVNAEEKEQIVIGEIISDSYRYMHEKGDETFWSRSRFLLRKSDGAFVYCIQPFVKVNEDSTYNVTTEDLVSISKISYEDWKRIERLAYYGYGYKADGINHTSAKWYVATQMLIWQTADSSVESYFTTSVRGERDNSVLAKEMAEINKLVNSHNITPSFKNVPSKLIIGQTITLTDVNGVLSTYDVDNIEGGIIDKVNQELIITATEPKEITFSLTKMNNRYGEPTRLYYAVDSQNVVRRGNIDPIKLSYNIEVIGGTITVNKLDSENNSNKPQGEGTLEGAIYGIYQEDGLKIGTVTTGIDGSGKSDAILGLGTYYLLEEQASEGYQLDSNKYYFEITEDNLSPTVDVYEDVIDLDFNITKVFADAETGIMTPESGVVFAIYNNKGEEIRRLTTDENGNIKFTLPYGSYTVKQLTTTPGYEKAEDFILEVKETGHEINKVIADAEISARLKVIKIDSETNEVVKIGNIKFKIFDVNKNEYVCQKITYPTVQTICEYVTNENGEFITPNVLGHGTYRLEEVEQVIDGYLWNKETKEFTIDENSQLINDPEHGDIIVMKFTNQPVKGEIQITKKGETVIFTEEGIKYSTKPLKQIVFGLFAAEDIIVNDKIVIPKGTKISEKQTNKDGKVIFNNLYLGKYYIQEIATVDGYVLDDTKYEVELVYDNPYTPIVVYSKEITNLLITGGLEFTKTDISESHTLPNTLIEIYTENDELIFSGRTDENGKIVIDRLPQGKYYILEKEAPEGYKINLEKMYFEIKENGEIIKATMEDELITGTLEFTKIDISTGAPLPNTLIEIYTENDELIFSGRTDENGQIIIENLEYGKYYILEKEAPKGYKLNPNKLYFEIRIDGEIVKSILENEIIEVPITFKTDYKQVILIGSLLILVGIGMIIYDTKTRK